MAGREVDGPAVRCQRWRRPRGSIGIASGRERRSALTCSQVVAERRDLSAGCADLPGARHRAHLPGPRNRPLATGYPMNDTQQEIVCKDCGKTFTFTEADAAYFARRGWPIPPTSCRACRTRSRRKEARSMSGGEQPAYATGDPNEYRSPMDCSFPTPPRVMDTRRKRPAPTDGPVDDDVWATDPNAVGDPNEYRSPMQTAEPVQARRGGRRHGPRFDRADDPRATAYRRQVVGDASEYRSPMGGPSRPEQPRAGHAGVEGGETRAKRDRGRPRRSRTMYEVVCAQCGAATQVPFEPTQGRDVYCRSCFAARRAASREQTADSQG